MTPDDVGNGSIVVVRWRKETVTVAEPYYDDTYKRRQWWLMGDEVSREDSEIEPLVILATRKQIEEIEHPVRSGP